MTETFAVFGTNPRTGAAPAPVAADSTEADVTRLVSAAAEASR